jgi:hypothetical protein
MQPAAPPAVSVQRLRDDCTKRWPTARLALTAFLNLGSAISLNETDDFSYMLFGGVNSGPLGYPLTLSSSIN